MSDTHTNPTDPTLASRDRRAGPISDGEWQVALETLREHGPEKAKLVFARGRVASDGRPSRVRTLADFLERSPAKRAEWEDALAEFVATFVSEAHKSALTPEVIERYDRKTGTLIERRVSRRDMNWMLIHVLRKLDPESWSERRRVAVDGKVEHSHTLSDGHTYRLAASDVLGLSPSDQSDLFRLLDLIEQNRAPAVQPQESEHELIDEPEPPRQLPPPEATTREVNGGGARGA
jgi:hypothetical protein